jgi:Bardet-Biedl syndrome 7 protein
LKQPSIPLYYSFDYLLGTVKDKIFVAVGSDIRGYTKKGKLFLDFGTNLTETIESMSISGSNLLTCGNHVYNHYLDCRDTNYFLSEDVITDVLALPGEKVIFNKTHLSHISFFTGLTF